MDEAEVPAPARRRRRAVGPPGSRPGAAEDGPGTWTDTTPPDPDAVEPDEDERLQREVPPHHGS